ncbi:MAG TPA: hypothetical protein VHB21_02910 [Minicystis sp.]|nr:hypothetical protein [Minicystis sp.]
MKKAPAALLGVLASMAAACGTNAKTADCDALISTVNAEVDQVNRARNKLKETESPSEVENLATTLENAAHTIEHVPVADAKLDGLRRAYVEFLLKEARTRRAIVEGRRHREKEHVAKLREELKKAAGEEPKLVGAVNKACGR